MPAIQTMTRPAVESVGYRTKRILIADDHTLIRQALIGLLSEVFPDWEFRQAGDLHSVERELGDDDVDLLVTDLGMPGMSGRASLRELRVKYPQLRVAVLTSRDDHGTILDCLGAGVHGYILKVDAADQLLLAVRTILAGGIYLPATLSQVIHDTQPESAALPVPLPMAESPAGLTGRQQEVLDLLAQGRSTKDIARRMQLGIGTVKVHLTGVYRALGARNRTEAVAKAAAGRFGSPAPALC